MKKYIITGIILGLLGGVAGYVYAAYFQTIEYTSNGTLAVLTPEAVNQPKDFAEIAKSRSVLEAVGRRDSINESYSSLLAMVTATNTTGTNIITLSATTSTGEKSRRIVVAVSEELGKQVERLYGKNNIKVVDEASQGSSVSGISAGKAALMGAFAGVIVAAAAAFIFYDPKKVEKENMKQKKVARSEKSLLDDDELDPRFFEDEVPKKEEEPVIRRVGYKYAKTDSEEKKRSQPAYRRTNRLQ
ncbi:hypothetical protein B7Y92_00465 [Candidatus Saccharibacteria bacterium 32-50-13]|nr:MAG: hypothetical protein B7Y92_00465 [Candidatus Saccharibacteria bacterium 32-50-13]